MGDDHFIRPDNNLSDFERIELAIRRALSAERGKMPQDLSVIRTLDLLCQEIDIICKRGGM